MSSQLGGLPNQALQISGGIVSAVSAATVEQAVAAQQAIPILEAQAENLEAQAKVANTELLAAMEAAALAVQKVGLAAPAQQAAAIAAAEAGEEAEKDAVAVAQNLQEQLKAAVEKAEAAKAAA
jgi:colicin import membrane protein